MDQRPQFGHITTAMEVCDREGEKIGSVARLYRRRPAGGEPANPSDRAEILEVQTGPFGWGAHLFIPLEAVQDATHQTLFLTRRKRDLDQSWRTKLPDLIPVR
jgi:hypothetical protein